MVQDKPEGNTWMCTLGGRQKNTRVLPSKKGEKWKGEGLWGLGKDAFLLGSRRGIQSTEITLVRNQEKWRAAQVGATGGKN